MRESRPPTVAVMGHIDHGKSSLIDYIRKTNITEKEAGGITQHISAYEVTHILKDKREMHITFLDTPGHEAFQAIRTRGAGVADLAILVVSGEDGVKPQTLEALSCIKEGGLPYIIAITKMDKPSANVDRTKQNLAENNILVEGYGGDIPMVPLSAKTGEGVDELLEIVSLVADIQELKADKEDLGSGVIIESHLDPKQGITGIGIVKEGTVRTGTFVASEGAWAPVRFLLDAEGNKSEELTPSRAVQIAGWDELPRVGQEFKTFLKKNDAIKYAEKKESSIQNKKKQLEEGVTSLPIIIKADAAGSLEAIINLVEKLKRERIVPDIILSGIGTVREGDLKTALATEGTSIFAFNVKTDTQAEAMAERAGIQIYSYDVIYELGDKVKELLEINEPKVEAEEVIGSAKIIKVFSKTKDKQVVGGKVVSGSLTNKGEVKIKRRDAELGKGKMKELQQSKVAQEKVLEGNEFGALIESKVEIAPGDTIDVIVIVKK